EGLPPTMNRNLSARYESGPIPDESSPDGPTPAELAAIEAERPLIDAELDELDCLISIISADNDPTHIDVRRYRRAQRRVLREMRAFLDLVLTCADDPGEVA